MARVALVADDGSKVCPEPTRRLPALLLAGRRDHARALRRSARRTSASARVEEARRLALDAGVSAHLLFPDARAEDWLDCGQCRDCFKPTFALRPRKSVQYTLAISNFDEPEPDGSPLRFRYGFIASSDNHKARPGTGYKQYERRRMTEAHRPALEVLPGCAPARAARAHARAISIRGAPAKPPQELQGLLALRHRARRAASSIRAVWWRFTPRGAPASRSGTRSSAAKCTGRAARASCSGSTC